MEMPPGLSRPKPTFGAGGSTWPTSAPKPASTAIWRSAATAERDILLALAAAEGRHEQHWLALLKGDVGKPRRSDIRPTRPSTRRCAVSHGVADITTQLEWDESSLALT
jgi:hypothetical protein